VDIVLSHTVPKLAATETVFHPLIPGQDAAWPADGREYGPATAGASWRRRGSGLASSAVS